MNGTEREFGRVIGYAAPARSDSEPITRGRVLNWIRVTHRWLGLWGAMLGLAFGITGFLMNHRTLLRIPVEKAETTRTQVSIPAAFKNPEELTTWVRGRFALPRARAVTRSEDATRWGVLMRLHTGSGASVIWVLIADTIAGALMLLSLSGMLLWTRLRLPRLAGAAVLLTAPVLTAAYLATL